MIGVNMMQGWINGIGGMLSAVLRTSQNMTEWMKPEMLAVDNEPINTNVAKSISPTAYAMSGVSANTNSVDIQRNMTIENVIMMDGYEIARITQPYIDDMQSEKLLMKSYMKGGR